jgi:hypothetical protein
MRKYSFGVLLALVVLSAALVGCQTESEELPDFTVTFVANNGTDEPDVTVKIKGDSRLGVYLPAGGTVAFDNPKRPAAPSYSAQVGRRLRRWNTEANGTGYYFFGDNRVTQNMTLYAEWEGTYNYNHYWSRQLQYDSYGGKDSQGIYTYKLAVPVSELQMHPTATLYTNIKGRIQSGKTFAVDMGYFSPDSGTGQELQLNRNVKSVTFQLWDGKAGKPLSNAIEKTDVTQGAQIRFDPAVDVFTTTAAATDASPEANQLVIIAENNLLVDKITVYGTVMLTPGDDGAIVPDSNADVIQNFESFAHNSGVYTGLFAVNDNAVAGVVQTDDFAYIRVGNTSSKALLVGHLTANATGNGSLPKVTVTLPEGKTLADYSGIRIKCMSLSGNATGTTANAPVNYVIMAGADLTTSNFSTTAATAANFATVKTLIAAAGGTYSGGSYNAYPYFTWNARTGNFAAAVVNGLINDIATNVGGTFDIAFGLTGASIGMTYLVDDIVLVGKAAGDDYAGTADFVVADFENASTISKTGDGVIYSIVDLDTLATYKGKYGKLLFALSGGEGAIPGLRYTLPAREPAVSYNKLSFTYTALTEGANNKSIAVRIGADADAAKAATPITVDSGNASLYKTLSVDLSPVVSGGTAESYIYVGIGPANGAAGAIYLIDDVTLYY